MNQVYIRPGLLLPKQLNVVGLDVDGVLASTDAYMWTIFFVLRSYGFPVTEEMLPQIKQLPQRSNCAWRGCHMLVEELANDAGQAAPSFEEVRSRFEWVFHPHVEDPSAAASNPNNVGLCVSEQCYISPGWGHALRSELELEAVFVATGRPRVDYDDFANRFGLTTFVDVSSCREDYQGVIKPDPASLEWALTELEKSREVDRSRVGYVGDSVVDVQAAKAAGILSIGVPNPARGDQGQAFQELVQSDADIVVCNLDAIAPTLLSLVSS
jgi:phosphoglycolate phosphatase-like HAD superfamily hydrolase